MRASVSICVAAVLWVALASSALAQVTIKPSEPSDGSGMESSEATAEQKESARQHFKLGVDFYRERNYRAALIEFQRAYADAPHYKLLYNLGQASLELQEYASAIDYLTDYLKEGGSEIAPERGAEVEKTIRYLESRIAYVRIVTNEAGAELYVDDTSVGKSPLDTSVRVGAGRHKFSAVREGQPPVERRIDVAAGDETEIRLDFNKQVEASVASAPPSPVDDTYDEPSSSTNTAAIVMAATTGALFVGAVTMTIVTGVAQQDYQEKLLVRTTRPALDDLQSDAETKALVTDILWGATAASAVVTTVLFVIGGNESDGAAHNERGVAVHAGLGTLAVTGQF
jgi:hypothetical protein